MAKKATKKNTKRIRNTDVKMAAANDKVEIPATTAEVSVVAQPVTKTPKPKPTGVRAEASQRTAAGKFTRTVFAQIGGSEGNRDSYCGKSSLSPCRPLVPPRRLPRTRAAGS